MVKVLDFTGKPVKEVELPEIFSLPVRDDVIKRAFLAIQSNRRQPYGSDPLAGKRTSAHYHGRRDRRYTMMNRELSRLPRIHNTSPHLIFRARFAPHAVGGRKAHPPKPEKVWDVKINKKERRLAILSAVSATARPELVKARGHKFSCELPLVVVSDIENVEKTSKLEEILRNLGLSEDLERAKKKKIRAGKGKMRGRKYRKKKSVLIVVSDDSKIKKAASNIPGVDVCRVSNLNAELLAPGAVPGRLTVWSENALAELERWKAC
ncbi:MAG: 50S ribosomal protein L4 [Candidatus Micrarchaeota archaeon]|nr:50S ribosomal protein L4 [Candidatus Micrarchaeota archaeon]